MKITVKALVAIAVMGFSCSALAMECDVFDNELNQSIYKSANNAAGGKYFYNRELSPAEGNCNYVGKLSTAAESFYFKAYVTESGIKITPADGDSFRIAQNYYAAHHNEYNVEIRAKEAKDRA